LRPHTFEVSRADKVLFPDDGITNAELVEYYQRIGPVMQHFPDGIDRDGFTQQQIPDYFPDWIARDWIARVMVPKERGAVTHVV
jgi:bifunctional non-homologous end joining protein LigD